MSVAFDSGSLLDDDSSGMRLALEQAKAAKSANEVPVGAVVISEGRVLGAGRNRTRELQDPTAHAEMLAVRAAADESGSWHLGNSTLYVTLEPCAMCAGALVLARISRLVFGVLDPKTGACGSLRNVVEDPRLNHRLSVKSGVLKEECGDILTRFFQDLRR